MVIPVAFHLELKGHEVSSRNRHSWLYIVALDKRLLKFIEVNENCFIWNVFIFILFVTGEELRPESCSVIQKVVEESRDVAEAPLLEGTHHGLTEEEGQSEDGDQGGKGSCESVGSGSSFEELDMEVEEEKKSDTDEPAEEENYNGQQKIIEGGTMENKEE